MRPTQLIQFSLAIVALVMLVGCDQERCSSCDSTASNSCETKHGTTAHSATAAVNAKERCTSCESTPSSRAAAITAASSSKPHDHGAAAATATAATAAHDHGDKPGYKGMECTSPTALIATIKPTTGNTTAGVVRFTIVPNGVRIVADITGLTPNAKHAIHIHEFGDTSADDGSATGGHYNPGGHQHGGPESEHCHAGDLGNLSADAAGNAHFELLAKDLTLCCGKAPIIGRSIIIHAKEDDLTSQPAGNAGPRIAQGVIGVAK